MKIMKLAKVKCATVKRNYHTGKQMLEHNDFLDAQAKSHLEGSNSPRRTDVINFLLSTRTGGETRYLEIGVRDPSHNFNHIAADKKYSVDPGVEYKENPVDFKMTSDAFFEQLSAGRVLSTDIRFDVIFIDGLHLADQVDRDIRNALAFLKEDGFVVLHDCNPPTEWHARENFDYKLTPATVYWNGTTWKAFMKWRCERSVRSCCVDADWGIGVLSKSHEIGDSIEMTNSFYEYSVFDHNRRKHLNLVEFATFKSFFE